MTGASSGIGKHLAELLARHGNEVVGLSRTTGCDVSKRADLERAVTQVRDRWPQVDALICCAGAHGVIGPAMETDPALWVQSIELNLLGTFQSIHAFFPLLEGGPGRKKVLCFSGGGATGSRPFFSSYAVAKTGIVRLVEVLADEWRALPIDINAIAPGAIDTRLIDEMVTLGPARIGEAEYQSALKVKAGQGGSLEKVGGLVRYLLSEASDGLSGHLLAAQWDPWNEPATLSALAKKKDFGKLRRIAE